MTHKQLLNINFCFVEVLEDDVIETINHLDRRKATGFDKISVRVLKDNLLSLI